MTIYLGLYHREVLNIYSLHTRLDSCLLLTRHVVYPTDATIYGGFDHMLHILMIRIRHFGVLVKDKQNKVFVFSQVPIADH